MESKQELNRELPANLNQKVASVLLPQESAVISMQGSFGEAFVVTDRRVVIVREQLPALGGDFGVEAFVYPLSEVSGVEVTSSGTGGILVVEAASAPEEIEKRAIFFPSYDLERFKQARDVIARMLSAKPESEQKAPQAVGLGSQMEAHCSQCGAEIRDRALFCWKCGASVGFVCEVCGERLSAGSSYCSGCGTAAVPDESSCRGCGKVIPTSWYTYCPWCGYKLKHNCAACGAAVSKSWIYCANCGRKLGSEQMDPAALRAVYSRTGQQARDTERLDQPQADIEPPAQQITASTAAEYNARGKELFEQDDIEGAIREFSMAVELDPNNPAYHCNLAVAYDDNDRDEEALAEYRKTLELDPDDTTALLYIGYLHSENNNPDEAAKAWHRLVEIAPGTAEAEEALENLRHQGEL